MRAATNSQIPALGLHGLVRLGRKQRLPHDHLSGAGHSCRFALQFVLLPTASLLSGKNVGVIPFVRCAASIELRTKNLLPYPSLPDTDACATVAALSSDITTHVFSSLNLIRSTRRTSVGPARELSVTI